MTKHQKITIHDLSQSLSAISLVESSTSKYDTQIIDVIYDTLATKGFCKNEAHECAHKMSYIINSLSHAILFSDMDARQFSHKARSFDKDILGKFRRTFSLIVPKIIMLFLQDFQITLETSSDEPSRKNAQQYLTSRVIVLAFLILEMSTDDFCNSDIKMTGSSILDACLKWSQNQKETRGYRA